MSDIHVRQRNDILWLILDRQQHNGLTIGMLDQLTSALARAVDKPPHLIVITSTGDASFCSGAVLSSGGSDDRKEVLHQTLLMAARETSDALSRVRAVGITTVALVKGATYGAGCELAALCDVVFARDDARFRLPSVDTQIFPTTLSTVLPAIIGQEATTRYSQSGEIMSACEAMHLGLAHQVIASQRFVQDAEELLTVLAATTTI
jgi:enoyl-CoA hydratase/carnithine racemase